MPPATGYHRLLFANKQPGPKIAFLFLSVVFKNFKTFGFSFSLLKMCDYTEKSRGLAISTMLVLVLRGCWFSIFLRLAAKGKSGVGNPTQITFRE